MGNPEVSICIPVYNAEKYIKETIDAILNQSFKDFELIIIDNQSTDNTASIIKSINDERIRFFINDENLGMVGNWNECLKKVRGQFIQFVCADDILYKDCIKSKLDLIKKDDNIVMVVSNTDIIDSEGRKILTRKFTLREKVYEGERIAIKSFRTKNRFGEPSNVFFRNVLNDPNKAIKTFNNNLCYTPDWEFWIRLTKYGKVVYTGNSLAKFRVLPTSGTAYLLSKKDMMREDDRIFINSIKDVYGRKINKIDILLHKIVGTLRLYAKLVFFKTFAKKGGK